MLKALKKLFGIQTYSSADLKNDHQAQPIQTTVTPEPTQETVLAQETTNPEPPSIVIEAGFCKDVFVVIENVFFATTRYPSLFLKLLNCSGFEGL